MAHLQFSEQLVCDLLPVAQNTLKWETDAMRKTETIVIIVLSADRTCNTQASQVHSVHWKLQTSN
jgi:hypothetical protein